MVKLVSGKRGSGKTKVLLDAIRAAKSASNGNVVVIQVGNSLSPQLSCDIRLINIEDYDIIGCDAMRGFAAGIMASDYDCTHIFVDGILRIVSKDRDNMERVANMLERIDKISGTDTEIVMTFSAETDELPDSIKKYC